MNKPSVIIALEKFNKMYDRIQENREEISIGEMGMVHNYGVNFLKIFGFKLEAELYDIIEITEVKSAVSTLFTIIENNKIDLGK